MSVCFTISEAGDCFLDGHLLHPGDDPLGAARRDLEGLLAKAGPEDLLVLAGSGLGWHARAALDQPQGPRVVVYEPDPERRALLACLGPSLSGADLSCDQEALAESLGRSMVYGGGKGRVALFTPAAYRRAAPQVEAAARDTLERARSRAFVDSHTRAAHANAWLGHIAENFKRVLDIPDISLLAGVMEDIPALVVGAGPSLDQSLTALGPARDKALVLAAASALGPLAKASLAPHLAFALESLDESRQFTHARPGETILAAASSGNPRHFNQWPGPQTLFHLQSWLSRLAGQGHSLPTGGHATSAAFSLALLLGCDPIILVGQDLAFTGGRIHAQNRPGGEDGGLPETTAVPAIGGGTVETSHVMLSYITWYQEAASFLRARHPERRVVNATAAGALLPGFQHQDLESALGSLRSLELDFEALATGLAQLPRPRAADLSQRLAQARAEVRRSQTLLEVEGLPTAWEHSPPDSAARAALAQAASEGDHQAARRELEAFATALSRISESLHE